MSGEQDNELVNLLVQNLERTSVGDGIGGPTPAAGGQNLNQRRNSKPRKHSGQYDQRPQHRMDKDDALGLPSGFSQFGMAPQYMASTAQDMSGRDREWAEYVQIMNLPMSGMHARPDAQAPQPTNMQPLPAYMTAPGMGSIEEEGYNEQDEAHFVQSFVQSPQFLPYQLPGYFQHPGFTSQLYADGRVFGQLYPAFGAQQYVVAPENFQDQVAMQNNYSNYSKVTQNITTEGEDQERSNNGVVYASVHPMGVTVHDPPVEARPKPKKKSGPKSWADIANAPAQKAPVQRPKPQAQPQPQSQPQQILTKQTAQPADKPKPGVKQTTKPEAKANGAANKGQATIDTVNKQQIDVNPSFARFFVIKSYSEDDVHKAIKYNIWASTDSGNRRLDAAWKESSSKGPIYLFFSVNASGQFCGMAQMLTTLDYEKKCDLWAQDKWNGQFQLKWIFIKDIPNSHLRHIRLENNENKPVTNSRDTQEIFLEQGREMLRIFANFKPKSSILDDFSFYDKRQEQMKEKKVQNGDENQELEPTTTGNRNRGQRDPASAKQTN